MWRKRVIVGVCALCAMVHCSLIASCATLSFPAAEQAKGVAVIELESGRLLFGKDADRQLPMASTTKIMSALLVLEQTDLDVPFTVDKNAIRVEGSSMGLREGDTVTLRALANGMLLPSGNDAANAAAVRIAGSKDAFVGLMNARAVELGLENTHFVTPSGLDGDGHYSTARDMALLAREALANSAFAEICAQSTAKVAFGDPPADRWLKNHNKLLKYRTDVIGVKTGFTKEAGRCLVSAARQGDVGIVVVTLGCPDDWNIHSQLYDVCFAGAKRQSVELPDVTVPVAGMGNLPVQWAPADVTLFAGETPAVSVTACPVLFAPVKKGQVVGAAQIRVDDVVIAEVPLLGQKAVSIPQEKESVWSRWLHQTF